MKTALAAIGVLGMLASVSEAAISVYVSPNGRQTAESSGIQGITPSQIFTETFSTPAATTTGQTFTGYTSPTIGGTYTSTSGVRIINGNVYGGTGQGKYVGVSQNATLTLTLDRSVQYFGLYFTAGDPHNVIELYSGSTLVLSFTTATLLQMIPNTPGTVITAINGQQYNTQDYFGRPGSTQAGSPNGRQNPTEAYAYLHFFASGGTTFDRIVLKQNPNNITAIFENDNHSVLTAAPIIPDTLVSVPIPEPASAMLAALASLGALLRRRR